MESTEKKQLSTKAVIIVAALIVLLVIIAATVIVIKATGEKPPAPSSGIGYSSEAQIMLTQEELQAAAAAAWANSENGGVALLYKDGAYSYDGINFSCYIVNSPLNAYDMFLAIYTDIEFTDQIFLSRLVPPGSGFNSLKLSHPLELGDHEVYVVLTQVKIDEETGEEAICNQVIHTMPFHVIEEE